MSAGDSLSKDQFPVLDLYHHTSADAKDKIMSQRNMRGLHGVACFSTIRHGFYGGDYGPEAVHVRVPAHLAELEASYRTGEKWYQVPLDKLQPEHFVAGREPEKEA